MRTPAQVLVLILLLSAVMPCLGKEVGNTEAPSPAQSARSQPPEVQPKTTNQRKDIHGLERMMDQRDWDHRKTGRDWRMRRDNDNLGH